MDHMHKKTSQFMCEVSIMMNYVYFTEMGNFMGYVPKSSNSNK